MAKARDFVKALKGAAHGHVETVAEARARQRAEWLSDLESLRAAMRGWLSPVVEAQLATVTNEPFDLNEPDLGEYSAPGLQLHLVVAGESRTVRVRPRGMRVVGVVDEGGTRITGAGGRVDIECGVARAILLRFRNNGATEWLSYAKGVKRVLSDEVFFDLLASVTNLDVS